MPEPSAPDPDLRSAAPAATPAVSPTSTALAPLRLLVLGQATIVGALMLLSLSGNEPFALHHPSTFGRDFVEFYRAAEEVVAGRTPYYTWRYNKPPAVAYGVVPLTRYPFAVAACAFFVAQLAAIVAACWLAVRSFLTVGAGARLEVALLCLALIGTSYPVHFLLDRGNLDGFVALFISAGGLLAIRASAARRAIPLLGGALLAAGVLTKVYPALLAGPLLIARRWWVLTGVAVSCVLVVAASPGHWLAFARGIAWGRFGYLGTHWVENVSLANTLQFLARPLGTPPAALAQGPLYASYALYAAGLLACAAMDARDRPRLSERAWLVRFYLYMPFLIAMPKLSFHYGAVLFLPLCFALVWARLEARDAPTRVVIDALFAGVLLSQFPAPAAQRIWPIPSLAGIPGVGVLIVLLGAVAYRLADGRARSSAACGARQAPLTATPCLDLLTSRGNAHN